MRLRNLSDLKMLSISAKYSKSRRRFSERISEPEIYRRNRLTAPINISAFAYGSKENYFAEN